MNTHLSHHHVYVADGKAFDGLCKLANDKFKHLFL